MKKIEFFLTVIIFLTVLASACDQSPVPFPTSVQPTLTLSPVLPTLTPEPTATATSTPSTWEGYINEEWGFSFEHPGGWTVIDNDPSSGFVGRQVFWWVGNFDPMKQRGDQPAVDRVTDVSIDGHPAKRVLGHYLGAMGGMGYQQYLKYLIQKGNWFYAFTLVAMDVNGVPSNMMNDQLPISEGDISLFERMMATLKFIE
jgi:hypothetical protein